MKLLNLVLPFVALFTAVSAIPTASTKEDDLSPIISGFLTTVRQQTAAINNTAAGVSPSSPEAPRRIAIQTISTAIDDLNTALVDVLSQVAHSSPSPQNLHDLAGLVTEVLEEIDGSLNKAASCLGLQTTLSFLGPLVPHLNQLLQGLQAVVPNLLAHVNQLLGVRSQVLSRLDL